MLPIRLDSATENRLDALAKKTGRTKTFYARQVILQHLDDLEDIYLATQPLRKKAKTYSAEEAKRELGFWIPRPRLKRAEEFCPSLHWQRRDRRGIGGATVATRLKEQLRKSGFPTHILLLPR